MSVYDKVKHVMIPLREISPEHEAWIGRTADLASAFSREVQGDDESSHVLDSFFLQTAADLIWTTSGGAPCWSKLDVGEYLRAHADAFGTLENRTLHAAVTMLAFYTWLCNQRLLSFELVRGPLEALEQYLEEPLRAYGYRPQHRANRAERRARRSAKHWLN